MQSRSEDFVHLVRLDPGDKIIASLLEYLKDKQDKIPSGFFTGIGATSSCEIGWYDLMDQEYKTAVIDENCEIVTLIGNIAWIEGSPMVHIHVTLGRRDFSVVGGHLVEGTISVTGEIYIHRAGFPVTRKPARLQGLKLIELG